MKKEYRAKNINQLLPKLEKERKSTIDKDIKPNNNWLESKITVD